METGGGYRKRVCQWREFVEADLTDVGFSLVTCRRKSDSSREAGKDWNCIQTSESRIHIT